MKRLAFLALCLVLLTWAAIPASSQINNVRVTSGPTVQNLTDTSATIIWTTDRPAPLAVRFGDGGVVGSQSLGDNRYQVIVTGLRPNTNYNFQVVLAGQATTLTGQAISQGQFTTQRSTGGSSWFPGRDGDRDRDRDQSQNWGGNFGNSNIRIVEGPSIQNLTNNSVTIVWRTDKAAPLALRFGRGYSQQVGTQSLGDNRYQAVITGLDPDRSYQFAVVQVGPNTGNGLVLAQSQGQFQTSRGWDRRRDHDRDDDRDRGSVDVRIIEGPTVQNLTGNSVTIVWRTDKAAPLAVRYGDGYRQQVGTQSLGKNRYQVVITGLRPNRSYPYQIILVGGNYNGQVLTASEVRTPGGGRYDRDDDRDRDRR